MKFCTIFFLFLISSLFPTQTSWDAEEEKNLAPLLESIFSLAYQHREDRSSPIPIVAIGGCAGVGKSSFSKRLESSLQTRNINAYILHLDDFLLPYDERKKIGFNQPMANHYQLHKAHEIIKAIILRESAIHKPTYDGHTRLLSSEIVNFQKVDLIFLEGGYALCSEPPLNFLSYSDLNIFLEAEESDIIRWRHEREQQRLLPRTEEEFSKFIGAVLLDFKKNILYSRKNADFVIRINPHHQYSLAN
jgi:uridine kinase